MAEPRQNPAPPDVFEHLDYRAFLRAWFTWKKGDNPRFSHRMFARMAKISSPSLLHHVMEGKRNLTPRTATSVADAMSLRGEERVFFGLLVELDRARTSDSRNRVWRRISATRRFQEARPIEGEGFQYLTRWYLPAVRELARRPDFRAESDYVATHLRPRITRKQADSALDTLFRLGLLERLDGGGVRATDATIVTPHEVRGLAVRNYHSAMIGKALESIERFDKTRRMLGASTVCIPRELVPELRRRIQRFHESVIDLCDGAEGEAEVVYQFNLQLFPLSADEPAPAPPTGVDPS